MAIGYFVAELAFEKANPIARYIVKRWLDSDVIEVLGLSRMCVKRRSSFYYYVEICDIPEMDKPCCTVST